MMASHETEKKADALNSKVGADVETSKKVSEDETHESRELSDAELKDVAGGKGGGDDQ